MNIEQAILTNIQALPPDKKQEVLDFIEFLAQKKNEVSTQSLSPQQRAEAWKQFMESQPLDTPGLPEEALHRDTMYYE
jgi:siroheme synthase (precorrin-2 oxidase/ferrochelatase)